MEKYILLSECSALTCSANEYNELFGGKSSSVTSNSIRNSWFNFFIYLINYYSNYHILFYDRYAIIACRPSFPRSWSSCHFRVRFTGFFLSIVETICSCFDLIRREKMWILWFFYAYIVVYALLYGKYY